jgi:hypothetical protein
MSTWRVARTFALWGPLPAALTLAAALALGAPSVVVPTMLLAYFAGLVPAIVAGLVFQMLMASARDFIASETVDHLATHGAFGAMAGFAVGLCCQLLLNSTRLHPTDFVASVADLSILLPFVLPGAVGGLVAGLRCGWRSTRHKQELNA